MKDKTKMLSASGLIAGVVVLLLAAAAPADEPPVPTLPTPPDTALDKNRGFQYQEYRVGGRLERVTVTHKNGLTEIYRNNRADTVWSAQENEIGEVPNMRQWQIKTW